MAEEEDTLHFSEVFHPDVNQWTVQRVVEEEPFLVPWVSVQTSSIPRSGNGVVADRTFQKNSIFGVYTGRLCHENNSLLDGIYATRATFKKVVDGTRGGNWTRFINDGKISKCRVNVYIANEMDIIASCRIDVGDELFMSYGKDYWSTVDE
jgi:hypothetical protein